MAKRPQKPTPDFPMYAHASGYWARKIRGKVHYFGRWDEPDAALEKHDREYPYLARAVPLPPPPPDALTVRQLCNLYLTDRRQRVDAGTLTVLHFDDLKTACAILVEQHRHRFVQDLQPDDFRQLRDVILARYGVHRAKNTITRIKSVLEWGHRNGEYGPVKYGDNFQKPSAAEIRRHKAAQGKRLIDRGKLLALLQHAPRQLHSMILLGLNCGFTQADCANLPMSAVDLDAAAIDFPRPKTGQERWVWLWPETVQSLQTTLEMRSEPQSGCEELLFLNGNGGRWLMVRPARKPGAKASASKNDMIGKAFKACVRDLALDGPHMSFGTLRHVFATQADAARDRTAVKAAMGHVDPTVTAIYQEGTSRTRIRAVCEAVRTWLTNGGEDEIPAGTRRTQRLRVTESLRSGDGNGDF